MALLNQDESDRHLLNALLTSGPSDYLPDGAPRIVVDADVLDAANGAFLVEVNGVRRWVAEERVTFFISDRGGPVRRRG